MFTNFIRHRHANTPRHAGQTSKGSFLCGSAEKSWLSWGSLAKIIHVSLVKDKAPMLRHFGFLLLLADMQWVRGIWWAPTWQHVAGRASWRSPAGLLKGDDDPGIWVRGAALSAWRQDRFPSDSDQPTRGEKMLCSTTFQNRKISKESAQIFSGRWASKVTHFSKLPREGEFPRFI